MKILVLGTGGREHALAWKIRQSRDCETVYLHPGNAGTRRLGFASFPDTTEMSPSAIGHAAKELGISLVVIGPEALLDESYGDRLRDQGFLVFGPNRKAARLETSKVFSKEFMDRAGVPTARFDVVDSPTSLIAACENYEWPNVLKLDGLAAGKGVVIAESEKDVAAFADRVWKSTEFGDGPHRIVVEEFIPGREVSYIGFCDGKKFLALESGTDFKRLLDNDQGPNTGGMGVVSPSPFLTPALRTRIESEIITKVLAQLAKEHLEYRGALYVGVMVAKDGAPHVLEFNARFGDPETQAVLPRMTSDILPFLVATAKGELSQAGNPTWDARHSVYIVGAANGYPVKPDTGDVITGWDQVAIPAYLFFSGIKGSGECLATGGGRVLGVGSLGSSLDEARRSAYTAMDGLQWNKKHVRRDIGVWRGFETA